MERTALWTLQLEDGGTLDKNALVCWGPPALDGLGTGACSVHVARKSRGWGPRRGARRTVPIVLGLLQQARCKRLRGDNPQNCITTVVFCRKKRNSGSVQLEFLYFSCPRQVHSTIIKKRRLACNRLRRIPLTQAACTCWCERWVVPNFITVVANGLVEKSRPAHQPAAQL